MSKIAWSMLRVVSANSMSTSLRISVAGRQRPPSHAPPQLAANGAWHRAGWFGAVLSVAHLDAGDEARSLAFLESAIAACRQLLGAGSFTS